MKATRAAAFAAFITACVLAPEANAQMYRCVNGNSVSLSDRPCTSTTTRLGAYAPLQRSEQPSQAYVAPMTKAPEHLKYLSQPCAELNDAIRTAPVRGVRSSTVSELHEEYRNKCSEDDAAARQQASRDNAKASADRQAAQLADQAQRQQTATNRQQCAEMLRILNIRHERAATMNAGELADLQRLEGNYRARCMAG